MVVGGAGCPPARADGFRTEKLAAIDAAINIAIAEKKAPGAVFWLERRGQNYHKAYGQRALEPQPEPMTQDTIFDAASLTKVLAATPAVLLLVERGQIKLDATATSSGPECRGDGKEGITIRQLLTHTSGLRPDVSLKPAWAGYDTAIALACAEKTNSAPGTAFRYSDINFFLLGEIVQRVTGRKLDEFLTREVYGPLKMRDTGFRPSTNRLARIAPTERGEDGLLRGVVHDPTARRMGGVAGHAGLFTTAADVARYARMMLRGGELDGARIFQPETVQLMTTIQSPDRVAAKRGLGWDIDTPYSRPRGQLFPLGSFGHTGWTGTALWIDPASQTFWILLSNRVHPDGQGNVLALYTALGTLAAEAIDGFDWAAAGSVNRVETLNGIDVLVKQNFAPLRQLRLGLIANHTGMDNRRHPTIDLLKNAPGVELRALFSPEHGIRGELDEKIGDSVDEKTGLPVYSLYGERRAPASNQLAGLDALVFDIQDIGCRFYTYPATMRNCLEAAAKAGLKFFVLDRVNPINGVGVEGPIYRGEPQFIAWHSVPLRHGLTVGELARMFNQERGFQADLTVIPLEGWTRATWFDETGLPWKNPSPNMRSATAALLYPGIGLHETALSVGRGTGTPFEVVGAPYIDDLQLARALNQARLPGVRFVPVRFTPSASTFKDQPCGGAALIVTDRERVAPVDVGLTLALVLQRLYPNEFALAKFNTLLQHPPTMEAIRAGRTLESIKTDWADELEQFKKRRAAFLLYR